MTSCFVLPGLLCGPPRRPEHHGASRDGGGEQYDDPERHGQRRQPGDAAYDPRGDEPAGVGDARDAGDASARMRTDATGRGEDERYHYRDADTDKREPADDENDVTGEDDAERAGSGAQPGYP